MRGLIALAAVALLTLTGCAGLIPPPPKTAQQSVAETKAALVVAEDAALGFAGQVCPIAGTCRDARVIAIAKGMVVADAQVQIAENTVRDNANGTPAASQAVTDAAGALGVFKALLLQSGIAIAPAG